MPYLGRNKLGFRLSNNRYEEIKEIVVELFIKYDVKCIPINGFELASKMGIKVIPYSSYNEKTQKLMMKKVRMDSLQKRKKENFTFTIMIR